MADRFAILGQAFPDGVWADAADPTNNEDVLYAVPVPDDRDAAAKMSEPESVAFQTQAIVSSVIVCNQAPVNPVLFYVRLRSYKEATLVPLLDKKQFLFYGTSVGPNRTQILSLALTLSPGDEIRVGTSVADKLSFTAMGIEVT